MSRQFFYTASGEFFPLDMPELEVTSLEDLEEERTLDIEPEEEMNDFYLPPGKALNFD